MLTYWIDHTALHSFLRRPADPSLVGRYARDLLQISELFLLSDRVLVGDTESGAVRDNSQAVYGLLEKHGLAGPTGLGIVHVSEARHRRACEIASDVILRTVTVDSPARSGLDGANGLALNSALHEDYLRPAKSKPLDYVGIANTAFASEEAEQILDSCYLEKNWEKTGSAALLNPELHLWLRTIAKDFPDNTDPVYQQVNAIFRWRINEQLARLSFQDRSDAIVAGGYSPAVGRAKAISRYIAAIPERERLSRFASEGWDILEKRLDQSVRDSLMANLGVGSSLELPLVALWFIGCLPKKVSLETYIERLALFREHDYLKTVRRWLSSPSTDDYEIDAVGRSVRRELGLPAKDKEGRISFRAGLQIVPYPALKVEAEREVPKGSANFRQQGGRAARALARRLLATREVTALAGIFREIDGRTAGGRKALDVCRSLLSEREQVSK